jgi:hypothetical protein
MKIKKFDITKSDDIITSRIFTVRGFKVMIDRDLAFLYGIETKRLNEQVSRNLKRFPDDFMFQLNKEEFINLKSQIATSSWGGTRKLPYVFTEHGVLMLSSVLISERAIKVNIQIMRVYIRMRELMITHKDILLKLEELESKVSSHDEKIILIFEYLKKLIAPETKIRKRVGYKIDGIPDELSEPKHKYNKIRNKK